jgi:magnesium transporter
MHQLIVARPDGTCQKEETVERISELLKNKEVVVWLDLEQPDAKELALIKEEFGFHPLAIEDATHLQQRPKVDSYDDHYFFIFYSIGWGKYAHEVEEKDGMRIRQIGMFAGENYLVTIHRRHIPEIADTQRRWQTNRRLIGQNVGALTHALLDAIVDNYFPVIDQLAERVEQMEEEIFEKFRDEVITDIFALKKDLLNLRRVVSPARDVLNIMLRREMPVFDEHTLLYLTDVYDHIVRVTDSIDTYRDLLSSALDGYLSMASNRMNQTMRVLTSSSIILMSMALVAGIYGMNFEFMPELKWPFGYAFSLGLMIVIGGVLAAFFKKRGWF